MRHLSFMLAALAFVLLLRPNDPPGPSPLPRPTITSAEGTPERLPLLSSSLQPEDRLLGDHRAFELGAGDQDVEGQIARGARAWSHFEPLRRCDERHAGALQLSYVRDGIEDGPAEAAQLPDQDPRDPVLAREFHHPAQPWAIVTRSRSRFLYLGDQLEPTGLGRAPKLIARDRWILVDRRNAVVRHRGARRC